jgi:hypothetical protein
MTVEVPDQPVETHCPKLLLRGLSGDIRFTRFRYDLIVLIVAEAVRYQRPREDGSSGHALELQPSRYIAAVTLSPPPEARVFEEYGEHGDAMPRIYVDAYALNRLTDDQGDL